MDEHSTLLYIMLSQMKGIGPVSQTSLLKLCGGDIKQCFEMDEEDLYRLNETLPAGQRLAGTKIGAFLSGRNSTEKRYEAKAVLESCRKLGISVITKEDIHYPGRFSSLPDMPCLLYVKGRLAINDYSVSAGIVGARRCTPEDKGKAILTAEQEVKKGNAIVSGMAKGIDSYAHTAALKSGGYTIAVLGNGPDICYPKEHQTLYEAIAQMGCVVSEYPPGVTPRSYMFPRRNRLIAALSDKLYIIGAGRNSGTNTTAAFCRKYERIWKPYGLSFDNIVQLETLGLVKTELNSFTTKLSAVANIIDKEENSLKYFQHKKEFPEGIVTFPVGGVIFTKDGTALYKSVSVEEYPDYWENVILPAASNYIKNITKKNT